MGIDVGQLVQSIWPVDELAGEYEALVEELEAPSVTGEKGTMEYLPVLHATGWRFIGVCQRDPQLPVPLLPKGWQGFRAAERFMRGPRRAALADLAFHR